MAEESLKKKTVKGTFWSSIERFSVQAIQFIVMIFMARILTLFDCFLWPQYSPSGNLFKKETIEKLGGFTKENRAPDAFFFKLIYYAKVYKINQTLIYYRWEINESMNSSTMDQLCTLNHNARQQIWEKLGFPRFWRKNALLYTDYNLQTKFQTINPDFRWSQMPKYTEKELHKSRIFFRFGNLLRRFYVKYLNKNIKVKF